MTASRAASLLLADELFCIAHDDRTGRCRVHPRVLGLGLAAGLLGELVLYGRVAVDHDGGLRVVRRDPPTDALAHTTLDQLLAQPQHRDVRTWLAFLAGTAAEAVARRLVLAGVWQPAVRRRLGRSRLAYVPVDVNVVAWRAMRLAHELTSTQLVDVDDVMLAGLVAATGLTDVVLWQPATRERGLERLRTEVQVLLWPLYYLLAFTEAAIGDAVLTPR